MKIYNAVSKVAGVLAKDGISKDRSNHQQGYKFRGIDDCLNALAPLLSEYGVIIYPEVLERDVIERETRNGGALFYVTVKVKYSFVADDGSSFPVTTYGEAMDSADKATNKAMSAAYKYAVIQTFCIPTEGDNDADAQTHEVLPLGAKLSTAPAARAANAKKLQTMKEPKTSTPSTGIDDVRWNEFMDYAGDDPDRMGVIAQLKEVLAIGMVSDLQGEARRSFIVEFQESCTNLGVPCEEWVKI
jgi:ERF superfamily